VFWLSIISFLDVHVCSRWFHDIQLDEFIAKAFTHIPCLESEGADVTTVCADVNCRTIFTNDPMTLQVYENTSLLNPLCNKNVRKMYRVLEDDRKDDMLHKKLNKP
jgi:hypothetical protein